MRYALRALPLGCARTSPGVVLEAIPGRADRVHARHHARPCTAKKGIVWHSFVTCCHASGGMPRQRLWSAIIESPHHKRVSLQTARSACKAKHYWTIMSLAATIARNDSPVSEGCFAYAESPALVPSPSAVDMHAADAPSRCNTLPLALSAFPHG